MRTQQIRRLIEEGKRIEQNQGLVRQGLINLANMNGRQATEIELQSVTQFIIQYVEHVPALIEMIERSAAAAGVLDDIRPIIAAAEDYFLSPDDLIPDHLGLLGLMDDAYLAHCLLQEIAERYKAQLGSNLLPIDMAQTNALFRNLVGEPTASMLDNHVSVTLNGPSIEPQMQQLMQMLGQINIGSAPDPIWGNASPEEIANTRLGAMGVI